MKSQLDPVTYGKPQTLTRDLKGMTKLPDMAHLNYLPPGENLADQDMAVDVKRVMNCEKIGPIIYGTSSNRRNNKGA